MVINVNVYSSACKSPDKTLLTILSLSSNTVFCISATVALTNRSFSVHSLNTLSTSHRTYFTPPPRVIIIIIIIIIIVVVVIIIIKLFTVSTKYSNTLIQTNYLHNTRIYIKKEKVNFMTLSITKFFPNAFRPLKSLINILNIAAEFAFFIVSGRVF